MDWLIGASTTGYSDRPLLSVVGEIRQAGIEGIELGTPPGHFDPADLAQVEAVHHACVVSGLAALSVHAPYGGRVDLSSPDPLTREAAIGSALTAAITVHELGGAILVAHLSEADRAGGDVEGALARASASLSVIARACRQLHVTLAVESPGPRVIGGRADEFEWVLAHLAPTVGVCLDVSHATLGNQWDRLLAIADHRLVHVHASDHRGRAGEHLPPGDGIVDWTRIGAGLAAVGYRGWIVLELTTPQGSLRAYLRRARSRLAQLLG